MLNKIRFIIIDVSISNISQRLDSCYHLLLSMLEFDFIAVSELGFYVGGGKHSKQNKFQFYELFS